MDKDFLKKIEEAAPSKEVMEKLMDAIVDSIPEEMYVVKEVNFNSDVINNEHCIFFPTEGSRNMFTMMRCPAPDGKRLPEWIADAMEFLNEKYYMRPRIVLIPFNVYGEYATRPPQCPEDYPMPSLRYICDSFGIEYKVMIPDRLKDKVNGVV